MARRQRVTPFAVAWFVVCAPFKVAAWRRRRRQEPSAAHALTPAPPPTAAGSTAMAVPPRPTLGEWARRNRKTLGPLVVGVWVALAAQVVPDDVTWQAAAWAVAAGSAGWWVSRVRDVNRGPAIGVCVVAAGWVASLAMGLPRWVHILTWLAVVVPAMVVRSRHFRIRPTPERVVTALEEVWAERISPSGYALPGSAIYPAGAPDPDGAATWDYYDPTTGRRLGLRGRVQLVRGKQTWRTAKAGIPQLASALGMDEGQILVDRWVGADGRPDGGQAELIVLGEFGSLREALDELVPHERTLDIATGIYTHGRRVDGRPAQVEPWHPEQGTRPFWISGQMSTGKSASTNKLLAELVEARISALIILDMKPGGRSLPDWEAACLPMADGRRAYITDPDEAVEMLQRVEAWAAHRGEAMKSMRMPDGRAVTCLPPSLEHPALTIVAEEAPELWRQRPAAVPIWQWMVRMLRALGAIPVLTSQPTTASGAFGGDGPMMEAHRAGNVIVHRNSSAAGGRTTQSALDVDPSALPRIAGSGWILSGAEDPDDTVMRAAYVPNPHEIAALGPVRLSPEEEAILCAPLGQSEGEDGTVVQMPRAGSKTEALRAEVAAFVVEEWARTGEPVRTKTVVEHFAGRASDDSIDRALRDRRDKGMVVDAGHGQWAGPVEMPAGAAR